MPHYWPRPKSTERILKIPFALIVAFALAAPSNAQPVSVAPWMTGQDLVDMFDRRSGATNALQLSPAEYLREQKAASYMDGVHDATEGKSWCYSYEFKPTPDAIHGQIVEDLRAMRPARLKRSAADLIAEVLHKRYPCPPLKRSNP